MTDREAYKTAAESEARCPAAFLKDYVLMECLSEGHGTITYLAQNAEGKLFVAKCYDKSVWSVAADEILKTLDHAGLPRYTAGYENEIMSVTVREYVEGKPLDRWLVEDKPSDAEKRRIALSLCDVLVYLHGRDKPVIHRDIKPQNVILRPDGTVCLIDFDIARVFNADDESDTSSFGTRGYAPPEQYGFSQTDCRTDIYSFGVLLRYLYTGSSREDPKLPLYRPIKAIIKRCTAFAPQARFRDAKTLKRALLHADPKYQHRRTFALIAGSVLLAALLVFGGIQAYRALTYSPFNDEEIIPAFLSDEECVADAVRYLSDKFNTDLFDATDDIADIGFLHRVLIEVYGLDADYVCGINTDMPGESSEFFLPWGWGDSQTIARDVMVYVAVKLYDPALVADWSSLKDDNGYYPGVRVATAFAEEAGITTGVNKPGDLSVGEVAILLANADRVFTAAAAE